MDTIRRSFFSVFLSILLIGTVGTALGADKPIVLKLAQGMPASPDAMLYVAASAFKKFCETDSAGRLQVEIYSAGTVGSERVTFESVKMGSLDYAICTQAPLAGFYNDIMVLDIPYLFSSYPVVYRFFKTSFWKGVEADFLNKTGVRIINESESGFRHTANSVKPIYSPDDFKGMKIRTPESPVIMETIKALGANPVAIQWGEVYTALQQKVADGHQNPVIVMRDAKYYEIQKYLTLDGSGYNCHLGLFNEKRLQSLPKDLRSIVINAAKMSEMVLSGMQATKYYDAIKDLQAHGMILCVPSEAQLAAFKERTQKPVIKWLTTKGGLSEQLVNKVLTEVQSIEKDLEAGVLTVR